MEVLLVLFCFLDFLYVLVLSLANYVSFVFVDVISAFKWLLEGWEEMGAGW